MNFRLSLAAMAFLTMGLLLGQELQAQGPRPVPATPDFRVRDIRRDLVKAPTYGTGASEIGGGRPSTLYTDWLRIEAQFESRPDWADDVTLKFYVLMGEGNERKLFTGEMHHINIQKGQQHYSAMYVHPNTLKRFGNGRVVGVAVELFYKGQRMGGLSEPSSNERWWERFSPNPGYLLNPLHTPWGPLAPERYAPIKPVL